MDKQDLNHNILSRKLDAFVETKTGIFLKRCDEIPEGGSVEGLSSEVINFLDLVSYIKHLEGQNAFEAILPEQQIQQEQPQK